MICCELVEENLADLSIEGDLGMTGNLSIEDDLGMTGGLSIEECSNENDLGMIWRPGKPESSRLGCDAFDEYGLCSTVIAFLG